MISPGNAKGVPSRNIRPPRERCQHVRLARIAWVLHPRRAGSMGRRHTTGGYTLDTREIVVIGASAGGVEALKTLVAGLPPDFPAAVFVVVHFPAYATSSLPGILSR